MTHADRGEAATGIDMRVKGEWSTRGRVGMGPLKTDAMLDGELRWLEMCEEGARGKWSADDVF